MKFLSLTYETLIRTNGKWLLLCGGYLMLVSLCWAS